MSTATNGYHNDPEDMFHHTRMSLGDHIEELRRHMFKAVAGFLVAMVIGFFISEPVLKFINAPVEKELVEMYKERRNEATREIPGKISQTLEMDEQAPMLALRSSRATQPG